MNLLQHIDAIAWIIGMWILLFSASCTPLGDKFFKQTKGKLHRALLCFAIAVFTVVGWTKGPMTPTGKRPLFNFVMALRSGRLTGDDGVLAQKTELETIDAFVAYADAMLISASNSLVISMQRFDDAAFTLTNNPAQMVYIQSFFPRDDPTVALTNHNLAVLAMRQATYSNVLSRWVHFSADLASEPTLYAEVTLEEEYERLGLITNTWPDTVSIQGVECVRYDYGLPDSLIGVVIFPDFDLRFGSEKNGLQIGEGVMIVTDTNGVDHIGYDGWDTMCDGRVDVLYKSGSAIRVDIDGQTVTNGVYVL